MLPRQLTISGISKDAFLLQIKSVIKRRQQKEKRKDTLKIRPRQNRVGAPPDPEACSRNLKAAVIEEADFSNSIKKS